MFTDEDDNRPLLNNKDLDPDCNYFVDNNKRSCEYYAPSQLTFKFQEANRSFSIMHLNCRSIGNKLNEIQLLLNDLPTDILTVTETWLTELTKDTISIPGYSFIQKNREDDRGGGVGFFVRDGINFYEFGINAGTSSDSYESMFIRIPLLKDTDMIVGAIYRPPGTHLGKFNDDFDHLMNSLCTGKNRNKKVFLTGDFNIDLLASQNHQHTNDFIDCMIMHHYLPLILQPTRITQTTATLIDNIFTNSFDCVFESAILTSSISDHCPIITWIDIKPVLHYNTGIPKSFRTVTPERTNKFKDLLRENDWSPIYKLCEENEPNLSYDLFMEKFKDIYNEAFPIRYQKATKKNTYYQPWMTQGLLKSSRKKEKLYLKYIKNPTTENKLIFSKYRNRFKAVRIKAEQTYFTNKFIKCSNDMKKTWQVIRTIVKNGTKDTTINEIVINGNTLNDPTEISEKFNSYFTDMAKTLSEKIPPSNKHFKEYMPGSEINSIVLLPTTPGELITISRSLKATHSTGIDDIDPHLTIPAIGDIANLLSEIINCSLRNGMVPSSLKVAKILPIHKQGCKTEISNYRPISLLPFFSKLFERVMYDRLTAYIKQKNILYPIQHGFQSGHSTSMALLDIHDKISAAMENNEYSLGIFLDLAKAFDTVNHKILCTKLEHYGIRGKALEWFISYLHNRYQQVICNGTLSKLRLIEIGVPQGSILGPLLFLLYINDLPNSSSILHYILFADDSNVFISHSSYNVLFHLANTELCAASDWFKANKLSLNITKTNYILFRSPNKTIPTITNEIIIDNTPVPRVDSAKFLGVHIDQNLKWNTHINETSKKLAKNIGIIRRISYLIPSNILINLYFALVYPYLTYCNFIWSSTYPTHLKRLQILQKKALRVITKSPINSHTEPIFLQHNFLSITQIKFKQTCEFMYQYHYGLLPGAFDKYFTQVSKMYNTRSRDDYRTIYARTNTRKFSIKYQGPMAWNSLPKGIRTIMSLPQFRHLLRAHTLEHISLL